LFRDGDLKPSLGGDQMIVIVAFWLAPIQLPTIDF